MDSASGTAKAGRDRNIQAIFPIRGKLLNTCDLNIEGKVYNTDGKFNREIKDIINIWGAGVGLNYDDERRKYSKLIILSDGDQDGQNF
jgi:DNA gyrase subunit B